MSDPDVDEFVSRAESLYASMLKAVLEPDHDGEYVAIDPETGEYFLGQTLTAAARASRKLHPNRMTHVMRVGHKAALQLGMHFR